MERIASLPKPEGFFDPRTPAGPPTEPEAVPVAQVAAAAPSDPTAVPPGTAAAVPAFDPVTANALGFFNSDMAFRENHLFVGSFHGFNEYDIENR